MARIQLSTGGPCPAPSGEDTDIWAIFRALRDARARFGLRPGHVQTLQALLSFLRPGQGETVFASNAEICRRIGGIDERTLRRHIDRFVALGFVTRHDSPNGKRYRVRASGGECLSFGLSLAPLFARAGELLALAEEAAALRADILFLRKQILMRLAQLESADPGNPLPHELRKTLRRKLSLGEYRALLRHAEAECDALSTAVDAPKAELLPANDGQNVRHQSRSEQEQKDLKDAPASEPDLQMLRSVCDQAMSFASNPLTCWDEAEAHARFLAPMMGIPASSYEKARMALGPRRTTSAVFLMLQLGSRIRDFAAYFNSLTLGRRKHHFDPKALLTRLSRPGLVPA